MPTISKYPEIKICGIKTKEEIEIINKFNVSYIGFIFAKSKRKVTMEQAMELKQYLRKDIKTVGVFVNEAYQNINYIKDKCKLDVIQLHGDESVDTCKRINSKVWKTISIKDEKDLEQIDKYNFTEGILLDTYYKGEKGGTGKTFNWNIVKELSNKYKLILAGGLKKDNIIEAIKVIRPSVLDINSGVETNLIKDELKIKELFNELRRITNE
jgi:phosphoribosylanthranilate isomerase